MTLEIRPDYYLEIRPLLKLAREFISSERRVNFLDLEIQVTKNVFDPIITKSTSILAIETLKLIDKNTKSVLELGTGCGAVALYIANQFPDLKVDCSDILDEAINCIKANIENLGLKNIQCFKSDGYQSIEKNSKYDIIFCSPPASQTKYFDPFQNNQDRGLIFGFDFKGQFIRQIFEGVHTRLNKNGKLILLWNSNTDFELISELKPSYLKLNQHEVIESQEPNFKAISYVQIYTFSDC